MFEEGDSVTKLHEDMSDAVNIALHCQPDPPSTSTTTTTATAATTNGREGGAGGGGGVVVRCGAEPAERGSAYG
jgi:hypothetical protein